MDRKKAAAVLAAIWAGAQAAVLAAMAFGKGKNKKK